MDYKNLSNKGGLFHYFKNRIIHQLFFVYILGTIITNLFFFIKRNFTETDLNNHFDGLISGYSSQIGTIKTRALGTYLDGILTELRGVADHFDATEINPTSSDTSPYCFNEYSYDSTDSPVVDSSCLSVVCKSDFSTSDCSTDENDLGIIAEIFELFLTVEAKVSNYIAIIPANGTAISHNENIDGCNDITRADLLACLKDSDKCSRAVKTCLTYINCENSYTYDTLPVNPMVDLRCLPFYAPAFSNNGLAFTFSDLTVYNKDVIPNQMLICFMATLGSSDSFVSCVFLDLLFMKESIGTQESPDAILFFKNAAKEIYFNQVNTSPIQLSSSTTTAILKAIQGFDLSQCQDVLEDSSLSFLTTDLEKRTSTSTFAWEVNKGSCYLLIVGWTLSLDTLIDLATTEDTTQFSILFVKDLTQNKDIKEQVTFISKQILFFKLYLEVFLTQVLFILISKFGKKLVQEFTEPLQDFSDVLKDLVEPNIKESMIMGKVNAINIKYSELADLKSAIIDFSYLCMVNQMIKSKELNPRILERVLDIFSEKQNPDGLYVIYNHLINHHLQRKKFLDASQNIEALIFNLNELKVLVISGGFYNNDELTLVNLKLFYNYYRLINIRKKFLIMQENNKRPYWQGVMEAFRKLFSLLNEIEIKETIVLKLMIKKANIHFYLEKINHAEEAIMEAVNRYQEYVKHGKTPIHWSSDQKILCYLQQKLYFSRAEIKQKKNLYKEAYEFYIKSLEVGPIYSPNIRSKCYAGLSELLKSMDKDLFEQEIEYTQNLCQFYRNDQKEFLFLLDSTKELNQNLVAIHKLIKDIFDQKMRPRDLFGIYCFSSEVKKVQERISKRSIKGVAFHVFNQAYDFLKECANEVHRHSWDAMSEALDILIETSDAKSSKYLIVFVFGDVFTMASKGIKAATKKPTTLWSQGIEGLKQRQSVCEKLIEKIEGSFVNIAIFGYNLEPSVKTAYHKICEVSKNGVFVSIDNQHPFDSRGEILDFF